MLGKILKKAGVLMMAFSILSLLGCNKVNEAAAKKVEAKLEEKYGEKFEVQALGNRFGTKENDTVTTVVKAEKSNVLFEAVMNKDGKLERENYLVRKLGTEAGKVLEEKLKQEGIESKSNLFALGGKKIDEETSEIQLNEYIETHSPLKFAGIMVLEDNGNATPEKIAKVFKDAYEEFGETTLQTDILIVSSEDYDDAVKVFNENADVSQDWLEDFDIKSKFYIYLDKEGNESDNEEILKNL